MGMPYVLNIRLQINVETTQDDLIEWVLQLNFNIVIELSLKVYGFEKGSF